MLRKSTSRKSSISVQSGLLRPNLKAVLKDSPTFKNDFDSAMYYAHYELAEQGLRDESIKYASKHDMEMRPLELLEAHHFLVLGKPCWIVNGGGNLTDDWQSFVDDKFAELTELGKQRLQNRREEYQASKEDPAEIQAKVKAKAREIASEFDMWLDMFMDNPDAFKLSDYDPYVKMKSSDIKAAHARIIMSFYEKDVREIEEAILGKDEQLVEAYSIYSKTNLKKLLDLYKKIVQSANMLVDESKVNRKPRKKKIITKESLVSSLQYMKQDTELTLVSINPVDIIGAKELWVFNTRSRKLGRFISANDDGLAIKGTSVLNYSDDSVEKILRKPKEQLGVFKSSGKVALRTFLDNIATTECKLRCRINEHHILLRVIR